MNLDHIQLPPLKPGCTGFFRLETGRLPIKHYLDHHKPCPVPGHTR